MGGATDGHAPRPRPARDGPGRPALCRGCGVAVPASARRPRWCGRCGALLGPERSSDAADPSAASATDPDAPGSTDPTTSPWAGAATARPSTGAATADPQRTRPVVVATARGPQAVGPDPTTDDGHDADGAAGVARPIDTGGRDAADGPPSAVVMASVLVGLVVVLGAVGAGNGPGVLPGPDEPGTGATPTPGPSPTGVAGVVARRLDAEARRGGGAPLVRQVKDLLELRGGPLVDPGTGRLVDDRGGGVLSPAGTRAMVSGQGMLVTDAVTGDVLQSAAASRSLPDGEVTLLGWGRGGPLASVDGVLHGLRMDGAVRWTAPAHVVPPPSGAVLGRWLLTEAEGAWGTRVLVDLLTGEPGPWVADDAIYTSVAVVEPLTGPGVVVGVTGRDWSTLHAWAVGSAERLWEVTLPGPVIGLPTTTEALGVTVLAPDGPRVLLLDTTDGSQVTSVTGPTIAGPAPPSRTVAVDHRGAAVVEERGVVVTPWRGDGRLVEVAGEVRQVGLTDQQLVLLVADLSDAGRPRVEVVVRPRGGGPPTATVDVTDELADGPPVDVRPAGSGRHKGG